MSLAELALEDVRCLRRAELALASRAEPDLGRQRLGQDLAARGDLPPGSRALVSDPQLRTLIRHGEPRLRVVGKTAATAARVHRRRSLPAGRHGREAARRVCLVTGRAVARLRRSGHRARRSQADRGGGAAAPALDGLGCVPRGTRVHRCVVPIRASTQAAKRRASKSAPAQATAWDPEVVRQGEIIATLRRRLSSSGSSPTGPMRFASSPGWRSSSITPGAGLPTSPWRKRWSQLASGTPRAA